MHFVHRRSQFKLSHQTFLRWLYFTLFRNQLPNTEPHPAEFHNISFKYFDLTVFSLESYLLILNLFNFGHLRRLLVLVPYYYPRLVGMAVVIVTLVAAWLEQRPIVVDPVKALFVDERDEHLVVRWRLQRWHDCLQHCLLPCELGTSNNCQRCLLECPGLKVKQTVRITVPKEAFDLQLMIDRFKLLSLTLHHLAGQWGVIDTIFLFNPRCHEIWVVDGSHFESTLVATGD